MQNPELRRWIRGAHALLAGGAVLSGALAFSPPGHAAEALTRLPGHVPAVASSSALLGHLAGTQPMSLMIALSVRDPDGLKDLIRRVHDPKDALYGHYLTPIEFGERFGATRNDYAAVIAFAKSKGLTVTGTYDNRLLISVSGKPAEIEAAFGVHLNTYQTAGGATYFAPDAGPMLPESVAAKVQGIVGLTGASQAASLTLPASAQVTPLNLPSPVAVGTVGTGPNGYLSAQNISSVYQVNDGIFNGQGQTVALLELGGFYPSDVTTYASYFSLPQPSIQVVPVLGGSGAPDADYAQSAIDIDAVLATAPNVKQVLVYEAPRCDGSVAGVALGWLAGLAQIAADDKASQVGISYGAPESAWVQTVGTGYLQIEDFLFQQMAIQGQSVYAGSGDNGAYADGQTQSVDSPASDPYVLSVGGTSVMTMQDIVYPTLLDFSNETTWNDLATNGGASGGGVSSVFAIPSWQTTYATASNQGSATMRNLPDVASLADPLTGIDVYLGHGSSGAGFYAFGGTGLASSLWVGFTAKVNQVRAQIGTSPVGLVAPSLYGIYGTGPGVFQTGLGTLDFFDIADGSTNGDTALFPALPGYASGPGYDLTTGLGSYIGVNLLGDLAGYSNYYSSAKNQPLPPDPTNVQAVAGNGYVDLSWNKVAGATAYLIFRFPVQNVYFPLYAVVHGTTYVDTGVVDGQEYPDFYQYYVTAVTASGESDYTQAPVVFAVPNPVFEPLPTITPVTGGKATVAWQTNVLADGTVMYATNSALTGAKTLTNKTKSINHQFTITGLKPGTVYYLAVTDNDGLTSATSPTLSFTAQ